MIKSWLAWTFVFLIYSTSAWSQVAYDFIPGRSSEFQVQSTTGHYIQFHKNGEALFRSKNIELYLEPGLKILAHLKKQTQDADHKIWTGSVEIVSIRYFAIYSGKSPGLRNSFVPHWFGTEPTSFTLV